MNSIKNVKIKKFSKRSRERLIMIHILCLHQKYVDFESRQVELASSDTDNFECLDYFDLENYYSQLVLIPISWQPCSVPRHSHFVFLITPPSFFFRIDSKRK